MWSVATPSRCWASSTISTSCSGIAVPPVRMSVTSRAWFTITTCAAAALSRAWRRKQTPLTPLQSSAPCAETRSHGVHPPPDRFSSLRSPVPVVCIQTSSFDSIRASSADTPSDDRSDDHRFRHR